MVKSEDAGFIEAVHATTDFEVDVAIAGDGNAVSVIVPDLFQRHICIGSISWVCQGRNFDVEAKVAGAVFGIGNGAVDV